MAVLWHAFCEMETGRLLLHIPEPHCRRRCQSNCPCHPVHNETVAPTPTVHHPHVLLQLNQCNETAALASRAHGNNRTSPLN
jgi:hypothetical protein